MQDSRCEVAALDAMLCICLLPPQLLNVCIKYNWSLLRT